MRPSTKALVLTALLLMLAGASGLAYWTLAIYNPNSELTSYDTFYVVSWSLLGVGALIFVILFFTRFDKWAREHGGIAGT